MWILNAPVLNQNNVDGYVSFVDKIVHSFLPNKNENPDLHELVKLYQLHRHSKTCRKYRNDGCRFHFRKFFSNQTMVAKSLEEINITEGEYKSALQISDDQNFQLHLKRPADSCFVNNYFVIGLLAWEANTDI